MTPDIVSRCMGVLMAERSLPVVDEEVAGVQRKVLGTRPSQSDGAQEVWCPLEVLDFIGQIVHCEEERAKERGFDWLR